MSDENVQVFHKKVEGATQKVDEMLQLGFRKAVIILFDSENPDIAAVVTSLNSDLIPLNEQIREFERIHALSTTKTLIEETLDRMVEDSDAEKPDPFIN